MNENKILNIISILKKTYPTTKCSLNFSTPFELVIAVMLSAQCTDERVNIVTSILFKRCTTIKDYINIDILELQNIIHSCGFYKNKSNNIKYCAKEVEEIFNGVVPNNMEDLLKLPGIGRKSANVILLEAFDIATGIAIDTHAKRLSNRIGLSKNIIPEKIENDLLKIIPSEYIKDINHLFVFHGRNTCKAKNPNCEICTIKEYCDNSVK